MQRWTFGGKLAAALALMVGLVVAVGGVAIYSLRSVVADKDRVIDVNARNLTLAQQLYSATQQQRAGARAYLLQPEPGYIIEMQQAQAAADDVLRQMQANGIVAIPQLRTLDATYRGLINGVVERRRANVPLETLLAEIERASAARRAIEGAVADLIARQQAQLDTARQAASDNAAMAINSILIGIVAAILAAIVAALLLSRMLTAQVGSAVQHVRSSAAELQAAANQQASGSKEQATAMAEITTTISELLATSRQIAESAQRVARISEETATAGRSGDATVTEGAESIGSIKRQVDAIVTHMLDLGRKSQEIGGILEIITELAEQTNILAVNAAIEAAGAGDAGRRFGVVAEEIRKLADRVSGSAKEIRGLIQDVRAAVNASVMTTETASKTVDAGTAHFAAVSMSFREISTLVRTTNEAAREIELSTKQQATAVEQVNRGAADVAQAAKEAEVTSQQMLDTVSQLAALSLDLGRLIRRDAA